MLFCAFYYDDRTVHLTMNIPGIALLLLLSLPPLICAALTRRSSRKKEKRRTKDEAALLAGLVDFQYYFMIDEFLNE